MMEKNNFYSNEIKLLRHVDRLLSIKSVPQPIDIVISLTGRCNSTCPFCYVKGEKPRWNQSVEDIKHLVSVVYPKAVELSGGEPTLHEHLNEIVLWIKRQRIDVSLTTNGTLLHNHKDILGLFTWIRVSSNIYIHGSHDDLMLKNVEPFIPKHVTYGFNYVFNKYQPFDPIAMDKFLKEHERGEYLRIAPDINSTQEELDNFTKLDISFNKKIFKSILPIHSKHEGQCYCGWIKPMVESDGNIYPCFRILADGYREKAIPIANIKNPRDLIVFREFKPSCERCYLVGRNEFIESLLKKMEHENFV